MISIRSWIGQWIDPVNNFLFSHIYVVFVLVIILIVLIILSKIWAEIFYMKNHDKQGVTNTWFCWRSYEEYYEKILLAKADKKEQDLLERIKRRELSRHPKK